jgi:hypothetical protein
MVKQLAAVVAALALVAQTIPSQLAYAENIEHEDTHESGVTVSGYKFNDLSGEGVWNEGEPALAGWSVGAYAGTGQQTLLATDVTDGNGYYELYIEDWNTSQVFFVSETMQTGWKQTLPGAFSYFEYRIGPNQGQEFANVNFGNTVNVEGCTGHELVVNGSFEDTLVTHANLWDTFMNGTLGLVWKVFRRDGGPSDKGLEIQRGYSGWLAADGQQFAELDGYHPVKIFQDIDTLPGKMYKVSFAFSPRPGTPAAENAVHVTWGGNPIADVAADSVVTTQTDWQTYTYWVPATAETMELALADAGATANTLGTFIDDVSVTCTARNGRALTGTKFNDINRDGVWGAGESGLADWTVYAAKPIGSFTLEAAGPAVQSPIFENGVDYIVRVKGTIDAGDEITADAMYSVRTPNTDWTDSVQTYEVYGPSLLDVQIDGLSPYWGDYTSAHAYFTPIQGTGTAKTFSINDIFPSNNTGSLFVSIYQVVDSDVTDATGRYNIEATDWQGEHPVVIMEQTWKPGWSQSFPGGERDFLHYIPWDVAWTHDWAYDFGNYTVQELTEEQAAIGSLKVSVQVINDDGGTAVAGDYTVTVTDVDGPEIVAGVEAGVTLTQVNGTYSSVVGVTTGYTVSYSSDCAGTMTTEALKECVVTLNDIAVTRLTNKVVPTVSCVDALPNGQLAARFGYDNHAEASVSLAAGAFENRMVGGGLVGQNHGQPSEFLSGNHPDAFAVIFDGGIDLTWTLESLDTNAVTVTSETPKCETSLDYPTLTLEKVLNNGETLTRTLADFVFSLDGKEVSLGQPVIVTPGVMHTITETYKTSLEAGAVTDDYSVSFSDTCTGGTVTLSVGSQITCTITNTAKTTSDDGDGNFEDQAEPSGSGGGGGSGGGSSGGSARNFPTTSPNAGHDPAGPVGLVLGETDEAVSTTDTATIPTLNPIILGVQDTLPRTGLPVAAVGLLGILGVWMAGKRRH